MNLPDHANRPRHLAIVLAVTVLAWVCIVQKWYWTFFFAVLFNFTEPAWRRQLFRRADSLAGFFFTAILLIFAVAFCCLFWMSTHGGIFEPAASIVLMEAIFVATVSLGGFLLHQKTKSVPPTL